MCSTHVEVLHQQLNFYTDKTLVPIKVNIWTFHEYPKKLRFFRNDIDKNNLKTKQQTQKFFLCKQI